MNSIQARGRNWITVLSVASAGVLASVAIGRFATRLSTGGILFAYLALPMAFLMVTKPRAALVAIILGVFFFDFGVLHGLIPVVGQWALDVLILLLASRLVVDKARTTGWFSHTFAAKGLVFWIAAVVLSAVANAAPLVNVVLGPRPYLRFALLYLCLLELDWDKAFLARCIRLITALFVIQVPIALAQRLAGWTFDLVSGTLPGTGLLAVCAMGFLAGLACYAALTDDRVAWIAAAACLLLSALAAARVFLLIVPLVFIYVMIRILRRRSSWGIIFASVTLILIVINWSALQGTMFRTTTGLDVEAVEVLLHPSYLLQELYAPVVVRGGDLRNIGMGRLTGVRLTWRFLSQSWSSLLLGLGPKIVAGSRFEALQSRMYYELRLVGADTSQLTTSLTEWGILGTVPFALIYVANLVMAERFYRSTDDPFWKATAFGYSTFVVMALFGTVYTASWGGTLMAFVFWFVGGVLERLRRMSMSGSS